MKLYLQNVKIKGAWQPIYQGFKSAWESLGFDVEEYETLEELASSSLPAEYDLFTRDWEVATLENFDVIANSRRTYLFAQPNYFLPPWGTHQNFITSLTSDQIGEMNRLPNVKLWNFGASLTPTYFFQWKKVHSVLLAYDSINYGGGNIKNLRTESPLKKNEYDVCYLGGWADNGFNEKREIIKAYWEEIDKLDIIKAFFVGINMTLEQEIIMLNNSKIALNIHDNYQQILGYDTNERTFKSLGRNGFLISDKVEAVEKLFPTVPIAATPKEMAELIIHYLKEDLTEIKAENRSHILSNHTYTHRVQQMLEL